MSDTDDIVTIEPLISMPEGGMFGETTDQIIASAVDFNPTPQQTPAMKELQNRVRRAGIKKGVVQTSSPPPVQPKATVTDTSKPQPVTFENTPGLAKPQE